MPRMGFKSVEFPETLLETVPNWLPHLKCRSTTKPFTLLCTGLPVIDLQVIYRLCFN